LILIVPLLSFAGAVMMVNYSLSQGWPIPSEWLGYIEFPDWVWKIPFLTSIAGPIASYNNLKAVLAFFVVVLVLLMGVYSTLYAIIYRVLGPPRYSAVDAPPSGRKVKRYKR
jgi:peptidoglycan/LPS O-acetylase OafA/YrhL